jgi:hypothetical protein
MDDQVQDQRITSGGFDGGGILESLNSCGFGVSSLTVMTYLQIQHLGVEGL